MGISLDYYEDLSSEIHYPSGFYTATSQAVFFEPGRMHLINRTNDTIERACVPVEETAYIATLQNKFDWLWVRMQDDVSHTVLDGEAVVVDDTDKTPIEKATPQ